MRVETKRSRPAAPNFAFPTLPALLLPAALAGLAALPARAAVECEAALPDGRTLQMVIETPEPGLVLGGSPCPSSVRVGGLASADGLPLQFDVLIAFDASGSTSACAGTDVDGDGMLGVPFLAGCTDPADSVFAAEIESIRRFVGTLSPAATRVGVVRFSDSTFGTVEVIQALTADYAQVLASLDATAAQFPDGATDFAGGVDMMLAELAANGLPGRRTIGLFLSDGFPTVPIWPYSTTDPGDVLASLAAASRAAAAGLELNTFAVGLAADGTTLGEMANITGGRFAEIDVPGDIVVALPALSLVGIRGLWIENGTTGEIVAGNLTPDGRFENDLPLLPGRNDLGVVAVADVDPEVVLVCRTSVFLACQVVCDPHTQGFWHRQCLATGEIDRGGSGAPPVLVPDFEALAQSISAEISWSGQTACGGLDATPPSDPCERALKQFTALLFNARSGRLSGSCEVDLSAIDPALPRDVDSVILWVEQLLRSGAELDCKRASDIADALNTGGALVAPTGVSAAPPTRRDPSASPGKTVRAGGGPPAAVREGYPAESDQIGVGSRRPRDAGRVRPLAD